MLKVPLRRVPCVIDPSLADGVEWPFTIQSNRRVEHEDGPRHWRMFVKITKDFFESSREVTIAGKLPAWIRIATLPKPQSDQPAGLTSLLNGLAGNA